MTDAHVLWVSEHWPPQRGGMAVSADRIVSSLRRAGVFVDVVHLSSRENARWSRTRQLGGDLFTVPLEQDTEHALARLHAQLLVQLLDDTTRSGWTHVVAFGGVLPLLAAPVIAGSLGLPLVTMLRGNDIDTGLFSLRRQSIVADAVKHAAHVCVVSADKARLIERLWPGVNCSWVPNGVDLDRWAATPADRARAREWRSGAVAPNSLLLGIAGQLKRKKGAAFLIEGLRLSRHAERFHLLLIGDLEPAIAALLAGGAPLAHTVLPYMDRYGLLSLLPAVDLLALPSFYDGMPNALLEGAGLGLPFLAARSGGMADVLRDGVHGHLFTPGDTDALLNALAAAATSSATERKAMGESAKAMAARYTEQREADAYIDILDKTREPVR